MFGQITLTFRYGREDEEVMGLKFCNEAIMCLAQLYPAHERAQALANTPLQVRTDKGAEGPPGCATRGSRLVPLTRHVYYRNSLSDVLISRHRWESPRCPLPRGALCRLRGGREPIVFTIPTHAKPRAEPYPPPPHPSPLSIYQIPPLLPSLRFSIPRVPPTLHSIPPIPLSLGQLVFES